MKYPLYKNEDLKWVQKDDNFEISDFAGFISDLLQQELLGHDAEIRVAKFKKKNGTKGLSEKKSKVLDRIDG